MKSIRRRRTHEGPRRGASALEVLVAFTLLCGLLAGSTSLIVKHGRIVQAQRQYRMALDELSNQIEMLSTVPAAELEQAVERLQPSDFAAAQLAGIQLEGELQPADPGQRLTLRIWWDESQRSKAPVTLMAWILPQPGSQPASADAGDRL